MTVFTLSSTLAPDSFVDWTDVSLWSQGKSPNDPSAQVFFNNTGGNYFVEIGQGEHISIGSFSLQSNHLLLYGALVSAGSVTVAADSGIQIFGGTLTAQNLQLQGTPITDLGLFGVGTVTVAGPVYNHSTIIGGNATGLSSLTSLTLNTAYIDNSGMLEAAVGATFTVNVSLNSGFANFAYGTLTGGIYEAESNATLNLKTSGVISNDAATLILDGSGTDIIASHNPVTGQYVPIQSTLSLIMASGTLELDAASYTTSGTLTDAGTLKLLGIASFSAGTLYVTSSGKVSLDGAIAGEPIDLSAGRVINNGAISIGADFGGTAKIAAELIGSGSVTVGPAVTVVNQFGQPTTTTATVELTGEATNAMVYSDGTGTFVLDTPAQVTGSFQHFAAGDRILLPHVPFSAVTSLSYAGTGNSGVLTVHEGSTLLHLAFSGNYATQDFTLATDSASGGVVITGTGLIGVSAIHSA